MDGGKLIYSFVFLSQILHYAQIKGISLVQMKSSVWFWYDIHLPIYIKIPSMLEICDYSLIFN